MDARARATASRCDSGTSPSAASRSATTSWGMASSGWAAAGSSAASNPSASSPTGAARRLLPPRQPPWPPRRGNGKSAAASAHAQTRSAMASSPEAS
eukprot:9504016-Pyramimonas_sp.AAC.1